MNCVTSFIHFDDTTVSMLRIDVLGNNKVEAGISVGIEDAAFITLAITRGIIDLIGQNRRLVKAGLVDPEMLQDLAETVQEIAKEAERCKTTLAELAALQEAAQKLFSGLKPRALANASASGVCANCSVLEEAGVICEIMNDDGSMARRPDLEIFAQTHGLKIGTIAALIHYRVVNESTVEELSAEPVQTAHGLFTLHAYRDRISSQVHLALACGELNADTPVLVRVQRPMLTRDLFGIQAPGTSGWNIQRCLDRIAKERAGVIVLLGGGESSAGVLRSVTAPQTRRCAKPQRGQFFSHGGVSAQDLYARSLYECVHSTTPNKISEWSSGQRNGAVTLKRTPKLRSPDSLGLTGDQHDNN